METNVETVIKEKSLVLQRISEELKSLAKNHPKFLKSELCNFDKTVLVVVNRESNVIPRDVLIKYERIQRSRQLKAINASQSLPKNCLKSSFKIPKVAKVNNDRLLSDRVISDKNLCDEEGTFEDIDAEYEVNDILLENENSQSSSSAIAKHEVESNEKEVIDNEKDNESDSDSDEAKSEASFNKRSESEYQQILNDDEVLDFEENDDDDEEDDGNFKRRKKSEKSDEMCELVNSTNKQPQPINKILNAPTNVAKAPIPIPKILTENKSLTATMNTDSRNVAKFSDSKYRVKNDMPLDNILKQMQTPKDRTTREKEVAIDDIKYALNSQGAEEALRLFCNKIIAFDSKERCFQQLLGTIALRAIKVQRFPKIHFLRKKLEESRIVDSDFWNKFISESVNQIRNFKDTNIRTMLQDSYEYLLRSEVNITIKSCQHLLDIVAPRAEKPDIKPQTELNTVKPGPVNNSTIRRLTSTNFTSRSNIPSHLSVMPTQKFDQPHLNTAFTTKQVPARIIEEPNIPRLASPVPVITPFHNMGQPVVSNTPSPFTLPTVIQKLEEPVTPNIPAQILAKCPFQGGYEPVLLQNDAMDFGSPPLNNPIIVNHSPEATSILVERKLDLGSVKPVTVAPSSTESITAEIPFKCYAISKFLTVHKPSYSKPDNMEVATLTEGPAVNILWECPNADITDPRRTYKTVIEDIKVELLTNTKQEEVETSIEETGEKDKQPLKSVEPTVRRAVAIVKKKTKNKLQISRSTTGRLDCGEDITNVTIHVGEAIPAIQIIRNYNSQNNTRIVKPVVKRKAGASKVAAKRIKAAE